MAQKRYCVIIGGTSGIGLALAKEHLARSWCVIVVGHCPIKIHALKRQYQDNHSMIIVQYDITKYTQRQQLFDELSAYLVSRVIYSAGIYHNERKYVLSATQSSEILSVNLQAFQAVFDWAGEKLKQATGDRCLVAIASVAGLLTFNQMSLYARCKRAMIETSLCYKMALQPFEIDVCCIASGYVDTQRLRELNQGNANHKPFLCSEHRAVQEIFYAITHKKALHIFPKPMKWLIKTLGVLPPSLLGQVIKWQYICQDRKHIK